MSNMFEADSIEKESMHEFDHMLRRDRARANEPKIRCNSHQNCAMGQTCEFDIKKAYKLCTDTFPKNICVNKGDTMYHKVVRERLRAPICTKDVDCTDDQTALPCAVYTCKSTISSEKTNQVNISVRTTSGFCDDIKLNTIIMRDSVCKPTKLK